MSCSRFDEVANLPREPKVENGCLRKLELYVHEHIDLLLNSLTLPALEQFACYTQNDEVNVPIPTSPHCESLLAFLTRSNCRLQNWRL